MTARPAELERELARQDDRARRRPHRAPDRSLAQRMSALANANRIRTARKDLKVDLKRGHTATGDRFTVYDVLTRRRDEDLASMHLFDLLLAMPKTGRVKANTILQRARISPSKTLAGLTDRQVRELELALGAFPSLRR